MSSSTSSFKSELKVIAAVLLVLAAVELCFVRWTGTLSIDLQHILAIPEIAGEFGAGPEPRLLVLGNSLTRCGIDLPHLRDELQKRDPRGATPTVAAVHPDATNANEWFFVLRKHFLSPDKAPNVLVVVTAQHHIEDYPLHLSRNAAYYCDADDFRRVLFYELDSLEQRVKFVAARLSKAFANRTRVQPRLFSMIIPRYQEFLTEQEGGMFERKPAGKGTGPPDADAPPTFDRLTKLLKLTKKNGIQLVVCAAPATDKYELAPGGVALIAEHGGILVDGRNLPGITDANLPDGAHLDESGARIFTSHLAAEIAPLLRAQE